MTAPIAFNSTIADGVTWVRVRDVIFADNRDPLLAELLRLADTAASRIVLDLSEVPLCDSSALSLFVQVHQLATAAGGGLRLVGLQPMVRQILHVTNLDQLIPVQAAGDAPYGKG